MTKGFALIELLVIIAIVGIPASIILYAMVDAKNKKEMTDEEYCNQEGRHLLVEQLPAVCLKYYSDL